MLYEVITIKPKKLFIAADGPRKNIPNEDKICKQARELVLNAIDWECEINTLFRDTNLGCGNAVYQAINWFFSHVSMGIILEDDCVPNKSFFNFCQKMLDLHKDRDEVMHISGTWYLSEQKEDYRITSYNVCYTKLLRIQPIAESGPDQTVFVEEVVQLDGSGSVSPRRNNFV